MKGTKPSRYVLSIPIRPKTMPRPRATKGQQAYYPKDYQAWRDEAVLLLRSKWKGILKKRKLEGTWRVGIALFPDRIGIWLDPSPAERGGLTGDIDNYTKAVLDCMQDAGIVSDDNQIVEVVVGFAGGLREKTEEES